MNLLPGARARRAAALCALAVLSALPPEVLAGTQIVAPYGGRYRGVYLNGRPSDARLAPFGSGGNCSLQSTVRTYWPVSSQIAVVKAFYLDPAATNVTVYLVVDNQADVRINGRKVGSGIDHFGCPLVDENVIPVPQAYVKPGRNVLKVIAQDYGVESFLDVQITADVP